jgi:hypothetical protein
MIANNRIAIGFSSCVPADDPTNTIGTWLRSGLRRINRTGVMATSIKSELVHF